MTQRNEFFRLDDPDQGLFRRLAPGLTTRIFCGEHAMLSVVSFEPHAKGTLHRHPEEQWGIMLEGDGVRTQGTEEIPVRAGDFWRTPAHVPHTFEAGPNGARVLDVFSPPREAYRKAGEGFAGASEA